MPLSVALLNSDCNRSMDRESELTKEILLSQGYWRLRSINDNQIDYKYLAGKRLDPLKELIVKFDADRVIYFYEYYNLPYDCEEYVYPLFQTKEFKWWNSDIITLKGDTLLMHDVAASYPNTFNGGVLLDYPANNDNGKPYPERASAWGRVRTFELCPATSDEVARWENEFRSEQAKIERQKQSDDYPQHDELVIGGVAFHSIINNLYAWVDIIAEQHNLDRDMVWRSYYIRNICNDPHLYKYRDKFKCLPSVSTPPSQPIATMRAGVVKETTRQN